MIAPLRPLMAATPSGDARRGTTSWTPARFGATTAEVKPAPGCPQTSRPHLGLSHIPPREWPPGGALLWHSLPAEAACHPLSMPQKKEVVPHPPPCGVPPFGRLFSSGPLPPTAGKARDPRKKAAPQARRLHPGRVGLSHFQRSRRSGWRSRAPRGGSLAAGLSRQGEAPTRVPGEGWRRLRLAAAGSQRGARPAGLAARRTSRGSGEPPEGAPRRRKSSCDLEGFPAA